jgi:hypothetical protein
MEARMPSVLGAASEQLNHATHQKIPDIERFAWGAPSFLSASLFEMQSADDRPILLHHRS